MFFLPVGPSLPDIFGVLLLHPAICLAENGGRAHEALQVMRCHFKRIDDMMFFLMILRCYDNKGFIAQNLFNISNFKTRSVNKHLLS